jgi:hypothetical protein
MVWANPNEVRSIADIDCTTIEDTDLNFFIDYAQKEILMHFNQEVIREPVKYIDSTRKNSIDNSNTTYYIQNWNGNWISDRNYDLDIDTSDVVVYQVDGDGNETKPTISSITASEGKIVLASAPANVDLYVSYVYSSIDTETPDPRLKMALAYLAASYSYLKLSQGGKSDVKFGNVTIKEDSLSNYESYYKKYLDLIEMIDSNSADGGVLFGYNVHKI